MKDALLIVNPSSGGEKAKLFEKSAADKLSSYFDKIEIKYTKKGGDAKRFAKDAAQAGFHSVFVMGGDGTVNEGISGLAEENHRPYFGFFPLGTVNDLARALDIPVNPETAISQLSFNHLKDLDIGKINSHYFMNVVAIGTIPEAINDVDSEDKTKLGKLAYFVSGLKHLARNESYTFEVTIDGQQQEITSSMLLIGLTNSIGGFEEMIPEASVNDGLLHFIYLKDSNLLDTIKAVPSLFIGDKKSSENLVYKTFKEAHISLKEGEIKTNVDGDEGEALPINITVLPSHLKVYTTINQSES
ncbi:TPA: diacylglycerol kinase family lipid kinase [Streptococcus equi subsp. zooepidemicus]|uniref:DAGKc domain-containing protein n=1 Tax=Streptococcus equi subsp. ruminatorum CECT 5772 TaxID=1051981 RepID=A0A922NTJ0_9STRE|nr:diacylglycerol kinase family protein [Streptococcus equi]HEL0245847.1 diacylglycerol kinase family lipid kinase [Streptococcus equi subsp. zooepidemicus]HEL1010985.1 diacylglycerol kinase family lipid kinase [Streptococcus equi subsp. ruminatorum]KED03944.1 hypothetical protein CECT5772_07469 [Streptococcus equi subsp. ruminatorum CECT 5772]HEL0247750.1 diacylglycerol kinase family lipid kinase [Streptococcus equi subsp. zooepidemicus]HEL1012953.1 diacylglycerol kinase family lipid kinase [